MTVSCQRPGGNSSVSAKVPLVTLMSRAGPMGAGDPVGVGDVGAGDGEADGAGVEPGSPTQVLLIVTRVPVVVPWTSTEPSLVWKPSSGLVSDRASSSGSALGDDPGMLGDGDGSGTLIVKLTGFDSRWVTGSVATTVKLFWPRASG